MNRLFKEIGYLFLRGLKQSMRPTAALIPSLVMPAFFFWVNTAGFKALNQLPALGAGGYLAFYAPVAILMSIFFSSGDAGIDLVLDITTGFFDKLMISPIHHVAIVIGKLMAIGLRSMVQALLVVTIILLSGGKIVTGLPGLLMILLIGGLFGMAWSAIGMTLALLTKNQRTVQSSFVLFFPFIFITTAQLPLNLLSGWYKVAVQINPATQILEAIRTLTSVGWQWDIITRGLITAIIVGVVTVTAVMLSFRKAIR